MLLNYGDHLRMIRAMKKFMNIGLSACLWIVLSAAANAACYADYKATKAATGNDPLKLHYGVIEVPNSACGSVGAASQAIAPRLAAAGWKLGKVLSVFDESGLAGKQSRAGPYFLRF